MNLPDLLKATLELGGSDLHLSIGSPPQVRVDGDLRPLEGTPMLTPDVTKALAYSVLTDAQKKKFEETLGTRPGVRSARRRAASAATSSTRRARSARSSVSFPRRSARSRNSACRPCSPSWPTGRAASCS